MRTKALRLIVGLALIVYSLLGPVTSQAQSPSTGPLQLGKQEKQKIVADDLLNPIIGIINVQTAEDFRHNFSLTVYEVEAVIDHRVNSRSMILAILPVDMVGTPRAFSLGIDFHSLLRFTAGNGKAEIDVEEFTNFDQTTGEPRYELVHYTVFYQTDTVSKGPSAEIEVVRQMVPFIVH